MQTLDVQLASMQTDGLQNAWDVLGCDISECKTNNAILQKARLNWLVEKRSIYTHVDGKYLPLDDFNQFGLMRIDTNELLAIVSSSYMPIQNNYLIRVVRNLFGMQSMTDPQFSTCGSLRNGKIIFLNALVSESAIANDTLCNYITFTSGHDGLHGLECFITQVNTRSHSTYTIALPNSISTNLFKVRHTQNVIPKLNDVQYFFKGVHSNIARVNGKLRMLAQVHPRPDNVESYIAELYPTTSTRGRNIQSNIIELFKESNHTWYDLFHATARYIDHYRSVRLVDSDNVSVHVQRADSALFGSGATVKHKAFAIAIKMAK